MSTPNTVELKGYDLAVSSGGATSVLAGTGTFLACHLAGIRKFRRIGGVSGGAIFSSIASSGITCKNLLHLTLDTDFGKHVSVQDGVLKAIRKGYRRLRQGRFSRFAGKAFRKDHEEWTATGLLGSNGIGEFILRNARAHGITGWPESFWTMATARDGAQVVFNKDGIFKICTDGKFCQLSDQPAPLDMAVRASATIPGIITATSYKGMMLFDGGLSRDGLCPVGSQIRNFGADPKKIIACRVGEDSLSPVSGAVHRAVRRIWQVHPDFHWGPETAGVIEFRPPIEHVHSLKFDLSRDEKWLAILVSFEAAAARLALEGLLAGDGLLETQEIFSDLGYWRDYMPGRKSSPQLLADRTERVLAEHGLY